MSRNQSCRLRDVRQIGPNSERHISGICSCCGTALLTRLDSKNIPTRAQLEEALQAVFVRHVREEHQDAAAGNQQEPAWAL